ncbi:MAG TPA: EamA family transporter [Gemmatimonadales bacterium]|nr:EamA family transporter [Gemmatimonadales bacterium]
MSSFLIGALLGSAAIHAFWNLLLKTTSTQHRRPVVWWGLIVTNLCCAVILIARPHSILPVWPLLLVSAVLEASYYLILTAAYKVGDFSLVYPVARGTAPGLLALWAILVLAERPSTLGVAGILLIALGIAAVGWSGRIGRPSKALALSFLLALVISVYSIIDGVAVRRVDPVDYTAAMFFVVTLLLTPVLMAEDGWAGIRGVLRLERVRILSIGVMQLVGYLIVLWVYARAPVSYGGAIRESSILVGALLGWRYLGESFGLQRAIGAFVIVAGVLLIALRG